MTNATQTPFQKDLFRWDGMYLHYEGGHGLTRNYEEDYPDCHPTRVGTPQPIFIARFKYGRKPYKTWINFICRNFTCEEWVAEYNEVRAPYKMMRARGYEGR
jgi:hypothetical protein